MNLRIYLGMVVIGVLLSACQTTKPGLTFKNVKFSSSDPGPTLDINSWLSKPEGVGPYPAVVLLHSCGGATEHFKTFWPEYLNKLGYVTLAVDSVGPRGYEKCNKEFIRIKDRDRELARDAFGALDYLATLPYVDKKRIGAMGFSLGALTINGFAGEKLKSPKGLQFKSGVSFYGHCYRMKYDADMLPLALVMGEKEQWVNDDARGRPGCKRFEEKRPIEFYLISNAHHAFDEPQLTTERRDIANNIMLYNAQATADAQKVVKEFLARTLGSRKASSSQWGCDRPGDRIGERP